MAATTVARRAGMRIPAWRADIVVAGAAALLLAYLTVVPLAMLLLGAVSASGSALDFQFTTRYLERVLTDQASIELLANSLVYAGGAAALAFALGTAAAWAVERTNIPARSLWYGLALVPLIVPGIVHTIAWLFLLSPEIGWINAPLKTLFGFSLSVYSLPGMIWVEGLHTAPLAFILMSAAFRAMDPSLEEAAAASRADAWKTFRRVTLPLLLPSVASVLLILFVRALEGFEVPAIIGVPGRIFVYTSRIYLSLKLYPPSFGLAAAYGLVLLAISVVGLVLHRRATRHAERYATVTGKASRLKRYIPPFPPIRPPRRIGRRISPCHSSKPTYSEELTLSNYSFILEDELTRTAVFNSLILGVAAATIVVAVTAVIAWVTVRTRLPGRGVLDFLAFVPITIPGIVLGISLIWVYFTIPIRIYGTLWILLVAYVTRYLPYGIRGTTSALVQIHRELEEAAGAAGARWWPTFRHILLPLLRPALVGVWIYVFIISLRELGAGVLLYSSQSVVLAVRIFDLRDSGNYTSIAALSVFLIIVLVALVTVLQRIGGRTIREA